MSDAEPFRRGRVRGLAGGRFHDVAYVEWGAPSAARVVVCVHGLSRQGRDFDRLAEALARDGYRVVCPDLPGRGKSAWLADPALYGSPQYVLDMVVLIARLGVETVDWIGTSLGGIVGMMCAAGPGTPIRRLVLNDVGPFVPKEAVVAIGQNLNATPRAYASLDDAEARIRKIHAGFGDRLTDRDWRHLAEHSVVASEEGGLRPHFDPRIGDAFSADKVQDVSFWPVWDAISCPTLLLRGERSDLLLAETAEDMTRRGPKPEFVTMSACGHAPSLLEDAQIQAVRGWLGPAN